MCPQQKESLAKFLLEVSLYTNKKSVIVNTGDIINDDSAPPRPSLPDLNSVTVSQQVHIALTKGQKDVFDGLQVTADQAYDIETNTRKQSNTSSWHQLRACRLTSSKFKHICSRKKDFDKLAENLLSKKRVVTKAMQHGLTYELRVNVMPLPLWITYINVDLSSVPIAATLAHPRTV